MATYFENQFLVKSSASSKWKDLPLRIISLPTIKSVGKKKALFLYTFLYYLLSKNLPLT